MVASALRLGNTYLGAQFRRQRNKLGARVAIKAMAAKLARLVCRMLRFGMEFIDRGRQLHEAQMHDLQVHHLKWNAAQPGFQLSEIPAAKHRLLYISMPSAFFGRRETNPALRYDTLHLGD